MKINYSIAVLGLAAVSLPSLASAQSYITANSFLSVPKASYDFVSGVNDLRVAESYSMADANGATHILIEGLVPVEAGSNVVTSNYSGINLETGEVKDVGRLYFTMPANASSPGVASSPIVGIVARGSSWTALNATPPATAIGGQSGALRINEASGSLEINLAGYVGTANYTRLSDSSLSISDFTLSNGSNLEFYGAEFHYMAGELKGIVQSKDASAGDALMFDLSLWALEDYDGDGVPDLLDVATGAYQQVIGGYKYDRVTGWMSGHGAGWGHAASTYGWVYTDEYPWLWVPKEGWLWAARDWSGYDAIYLWHDTRGEWIVTGEYWGGWFQGFTSGPGREGHFHVDGVGE